MCWGIQLYSPMVSTIEGYNVTPQWWPLERLCMHVYMLIWVTVVIKQIKGYLVLPTDIPVSSWSRNQREGERGRVFRNYTSFFHNTLFTSPCIHGDPILFTRNFFWVPNLHYDIKWPREYVSWLFNVWFEWPSNLLLPPPQHISKEPEPSCSEEWHEP